MWFSAKRLSTKTSSSRRDITGATHRSRRFSSTLEHLEARRLLSLSSVSPAWFDRIAPAVYAPTQSTSEIQSISWNGQSVQVRKDEWIVELSASTLAHVASVSSSAVLFATAPFPVNVVEGLGFAGSLLVRTPGASADVGV